MEETAFAKINLALHVRCREPDGYHRIETLFAFVEDGDQLRVAAGDGLSLTLAGPFAPALAVSESNLVLEAAHALRRRYDIGEGASLTLDKRLPLASGLGGGSADAAATLRLLVRWWQLDVTDAALMEIAADLGADVPACLASRPVRGEGRGDDLGEVDGTLLAGLPVLLVNPGIALATGSVFAGWDLIDRGPLNQGPPLEAARNGRNDLEPPALFLVPEIGLVLECLKRADGARLVRMSGSGASCFALFDNERMRDHAAAAIAAARPEWWLLASRLRSNATDE